jgi:predicted RNA-binding Zn-ribbon protein involved in translation (DUF1610 family)
MPEAPDVPQQKCPVCGGIVEVPDAEPLARVACPSCGEMVRIERAFDHFTLIETLGVGGMGSVYKARDTRLDRLVALKLLRKDLSADPAEAARLEQEARLTAAVNHPHVIQVYSTGNAHGQIYLVMELVDYGSLDDLMAEKTRVPEARVLATGIQVAKGLQAAQEKGLIHRDVKPANILFASEDTAKIGDFGLAVVAEQHAEARNEIWGTPYYVAPERLNNEPEDFRSDIYSLGATLFHAIAGRPPIEGETTSARELRGLKSKPPDLRAVAPDVSCEAARIINRMIAPDPGKRFASYAELVDQLQRAADPTSARAGGRGASRGLLAVVVVVVAIAAIVAAGFYFIKAKQSTMAAPAISNTPIASVPSPTPDNQLEQARREAAKREQKKIADEARARENAAAKAREAEKQKLLAEESPGWEKALADARTKIAVYDFPAALAAVDSAKVSEPSLVETQAAERKKVAWLVDWKNKLIADVKGGRFTAAVQIGAANYQGATKADNSRITFRLPPYGTADVDWAKISPKALLSISTSLIQANSPDLAEREWLSAVFASQTGQTEAARALAEAASKAKPEYREQLDLLR